MTNTKPQDNQLNQKQLYNDALYWHLIHSGYPTDKAKLIVEKKIRDSVFW